MTLNLGPCSRRASTIERLETSNISDEDLERVYNFAEFAGRFGGSRLVLDHLEEFSSRWGPGNPLTILDIRCGRGDLSRAIVNWARRRKFEVQILAADRYGRILQMARKKSAGYPEITYEIRDITDPMFLQAQQSD